VVPAVAEPGVEARLHSEVAEVLGDRLPTARDLPRLRYAEMVLAEAMRLYPPAWVLGRKAVAETEVGGYRVPPDSLVVASQWVLHHDQRWWPEPSAFRPERWDEEAGAARPRYAYFPFGAGPRICIGEGFAWMEGVISPPVFAPVHVAAASPSPTRISEAGTRAAHGPPPRRWPPGARRSRHPGAPVRGRSHRWGSSAAGEATAVDGGRAAPVGAYRREAVGSAGA
jgi:cytochrome P450